MKFLFSFFTISEAAQVIKRHQGKFNFLSWEVGGDVPGAAAPGKEIRRVKPDFPESIFPNAKKDRMRDFGQSFPLKIDVASQPGQCIFHIVKNDTGAGRWWHLKQQFDRVIFFRGQSELPNRKLQMFTKQRQGGFTFGGSLIAKKGQNVDSGMFDQDFQPTKCFGNFSLK